MKGSTKKTSQTMKSNKQRKLNGRKRITTIIITKSKNKM